MNEFNNKFEKTAEEFKSKLHQSVNSRIDAMNANQEQLYDIGFKVLGIANLVLLIALFNVQMQSLIHSIHYFKYIYYVTIYSYIIYVGYHILSLYSGNYWFIKGMRKTMLSMNKLQLIIDEKKDLTVEFQTEMNNQITSTCYLNNLTVAIKTLVGIANIVNMVSLYTCVLVIINHLI